MIKSLDELRQVDKRTLYFTPHGLGIDVRMSPEGAAEFQQHVLARLELVPSVAEGTRMSFDRLKTIFAYGVFCYDIFTLVNDHALLVIEQALRDRFIDFHRGAVTFVDQSGIEHTVMAERYEDVYEVVSKKKKWQLVIGDGQQPLKFNGMLSDLRTWARQVGLLRGQRNRGIEHAMANLRNFVAHPTAYHLLDPMETARTLSDLAEVINHLWGYPTPGGRLYPAPIKREVVVIAWSTAGDRLQIALADELYTAVDPEDQEWQYSIVRAFFCPEERLSDPGLTHFDALFEATRFPAELLWGAGSMADAATWLTANLPRADECEYLDRTFILRQDGDQLYIPMRPSVAEVLPLAERGGTWYVIRADFPDDAYHHCRTLLAGVGCTNIGPCRQCPAETLNIGTYDEAREWFAEANPTHHIMQDVQTPWAFPRSHHIGA